MMTKAEARIIADTAVLIRPEWHPTSILTLLADFRAKEARDVHMAVVWLAYDPATQTPGRLREDGPWWHIGEYTTQAEAAANEWRDDPEPPPGFYDD